MNPMDVLAPNYLGNSEMNSGVDNLTKNMGWGVAEATPNDQPEENAGVQKVKVATAKQFGKQAHEVF